MSGLFFVLNFVVIAAGELLTNKLLTIVGWRFENSISLLAAQMPYR